MKKTLLAMMMIVLLLVAAVPVVTASYHSQDSEFDDFVISKEDSKEDWTQADAIPKTRIEQERREALTSDTGKDVSARIATDAEAEQRQEKRLEVRGERRDNTKARIRYQQKKEQYQEAREAFRQEREAFLTERDQLRVQLKECKGDASESCEAVRKQFAVKSKPFLLSSAIVAMASIEKIELNLETTADLGEEERAVMLEEISEKKAALNVAAEAIADLEDNATPEEIQEAADQLRKAWKDAQPAMRKHVGKLLNNRFGGVVVKLEQLEKRLGRVTTKLEEKGYDTTPLTEQMEAFTEAIASAKAHHSAAVQLHAEGKVRESHQELKEAQLDIKEIKQLLRTIVNTIRKTAKEQPDDADDNESDEQDDDASDDEAEEDEEENEGSDQEIEVEIEDGQAEVEVKFDGNTIEFVVDSTNLNVIIDEIVAKTGLSRDEVSARITVEVEGDEEESDSESDDDAEEEDEE